MRRADIDRWLGRPWVRGLALAVGLLPFVWLCWAAWRDGLGPNPAEALIRATGDWTLRMLCVVLAVTPLRVLAGWPSLARWRRMVGLLVYFYACWHLLAYAWLDMGLEAGAIAADIVKRPFILVGFTAWLLLSLLALTSSKRAVRWLGGARWQVLHRAVYAVAALAVLHFFWMRAAKQRWAEVVVYAIVLGVLLGWRLQRRLRR